MCALLISVSAAAGPIAIGEGARAPGAAAAGERKGASLFSLFPFFVQLKMSAMFISVSVAAGPIAAGAHAGAAEGVRGRAEVGGAASTEG